MTKVTLGLQSHWRMANGGVGIVPRELTWAGIRFNPLLGRRRGWHYIQGQYSGGALFTEMSRDVTTQILCVLIGQGRLSRPMICLGCRSAYLRMFFTTIEAMVSEAFKPRVRFSKAIYIIAKYCINIMIDLVSRAKHLLAFPSFKLSLWWFLKIILA